MNPERGLQAAIGVVFAFSLLWLVGILVGDDGYHKSVSFAVPKRFGLVVNGTHYILDTNVGHGQTQVDDNTHIIHPVSPTAVERKLRVVRKTEVQTKLQSRPSFQRSNESRASNNGSSSQKKRDPLFPKAAWFGIFIMYHARRFVKGRRQSYEEDWFIRSGLEDSLQYDGLREYEEDFLSVDGSFYGSTWNGEELNKFDV